MEEPTATSCPILAHQTPGRPCAWPMASDHLPLPACIAAAKAGPQPAVGVGDRTLKISLSWSFAKLMAYKIMVSSKVVFITFAQLSRSALSAANCRRDNPVFLVVVSSQFIAIWTPSHVRHWSGQELRQHDRCEMPFWDIRESHRKESQLTFSLSASFFHLKDRTDRHWSGVYSILCMRARFRTTDDESAQSKRRNHVAPSGCIREAPCRAAGLPSRARW